MFDSFWKKTTAVIGWVVSKVKALVGFETAPVQTPAEVNEVAEAIIEATKDAVVFVAKAAAYAAAWIYLTPYMVAAHIVLLVLVAVAITARQSKTEPCAAQ